MRTGEFPLLFKAMEDNGDDDDCMDDARTATQISGYNLQSVLANPRVRSTTRQYGQHTADRLR